MEEGALSTEGLNRWEGQLSVLKTTDQPERGQGATYYAYLNDGEKSELGYSGEVVVLRRFETGTPPPEGQRAPEMRARCRLADSAAPVVAGKVRLDQTLRNSLGIPVEPKEDHTVDLAPVTHSATRERLERFADWALARRYLFMRVRKADPGDMEKRLVRIPADSFRLLGVSPGEKLRITHPYREEGGHGFTEKTCALQAYPVTPEIVSRQEKKEGLYGRYPDPDQLLEVSPDLGSIYLDGGAREKLGVRTLEVVRVRRSDPDAFLQRIRSFGLAIAAAAIAIIGVFPFHKSVVNGLVVMGLALIAALFITLLNLRGSSYGSPS
jgi:hypothetical protein